MGKGGGALSVWLKEFIALVFTQTLQAFIYAIIIVVIMYGLEPRAGISGDDQNAALGLMSTFALLSVFKIEDMAKKIFGIGDTKASHKNAMHSIAKTAVAAKLGSKVLNNAGKVFGGVKAIGKAGQDRRKLKTRLQEDMSDMGYKLEENKGKMNATYVGNKKTAVAGVTSKNGSVTASTDTVNGSDADSFGGSQSAAENTSISPSTNSASVGNSSSNHDVISDAAKRRMRNALRTYDDKLSEINKARDEGIKSIASGLTEFAGSVVGGTAGGILGASDGNFDEILKEIVAGAGAGDIAGKYVVEGADKITQFAKRNYNRKKGVSSVNLKATLKAYDEAMKQANVNYGAIDVEDTF